MTHDTDKANLTVETISTAEPGTTSGGPVTALFGGQHSTAIMRGAVVSSPRWPSLGLGTRVLRFGAWCGKAKFTHGALTLVTDESGRILLVQERLRERGRWGLPGGFMKICEKPEQAAVREVREEAGLQIAAHQLTLVCAYKQPWAWHYDHLFACRLSRRGNEGPRRSAEIGGRGWFDPQGLPPLTRASDYALTQWFAKPQLHHDSVWDSAAYG